MNKNLAKVEAKGRIPLKTSHQMAHHLKGIANHWRIKILFFVSKNPGSTLTTIAESLDGNFRTLSIHTQYLANTGLIRKKYEGRFVAHYLSPYGQIFINFLKTFQHS